MFLCAFKNVFVFICLCALCVFCAKQTTFFLLDVFYARLKLSLFLFAYVRFVLFVLVGSFRYRYKSHPIPSSTILTVIITIFFIIISIITIFLQSSQYFVSIIAIFFYYHNLFESNQNVSIQANFNYS